MTGLIPAHAGKTPHVCHRVGDQPAHPRSRGENVSGSVNWSSYGGSSPLTRGKLWREQPWMIYNGLIPAHAGKTHGARAGHGHGQAHPRSRGENPTSLETGRWGRGSSPLTRGKRVGTVDRRG